MGHRNVFVAISMGNKRLTAEAVSQAISLTKVSMEPRKLVFLLADQIEIINYRVFGKGSDESGKRVIRKRSAELRGVIERGVAISGVRREKIKTIGWKDIMNTFYWSCYKEVYSSFLRSKELREDIMSISRAYSLHRSQSVSIVDLEYLSQYIIAELPVVMRGINYDSEEYSTMIYPTKGGEALDTIADKLSSGWYSDTGKVKKITTVLKYESE